MELKMIRTTVFLCVAWTSLCLLNSQVFGQPAQQRKAPPTFPAIDAAMRQFVDAGEISGAVTLVAHDGEIVHLGAVGLANVEAEKAMKPGTLFAIASMTKPIAASAIMILQDEGKLSVDDKVSKYLPAFAAVKLQTGEAAAREITIRDLLTHTSGLAGNQVFSGSLAAVVDELARRPLAFQPGTRWQYSPGLNVAGRIVEVVSRQPLEEFLQQRIFEPLGMRSTTFRPDEKQRRRMATIYAPSEDKRSLVAAENFITDVSDVKGPNPSGGLFSTARDMFRFYQMVLNQGRLRKQRILSASAVEQMTSPQTADLTTGFTPGNCWGLGWCIVRQPQGVTGMLSPGTFGHGGAFGTQGWVDPRTRTIYVLMIQRTNFGNSDGSDIRQRFQQLANESLGL
jgi:CubicO group peptidase (beta-lactamase class C family)